MGDEMANPQVWIAFGALLFTMACTIGGVSWMLSWRMNELDKNIRKDVRADLMEAVNERDRRIAVLDARVNEVADSAHRSIAAATAASMENIKRVELYIRDQLQMYVLKEDFRDDLATITKIVDSLGNRIEIRMGNIEEKLDIVKELAMRAAAIRDNKPTM